MHWTPQHCTCLIFSHQLIQLCYIKLFHPEFKYKDYANIFLVFFFATNIFYFVWLHVVPFYIYYQQNDIFVRLRPIQLTHLIIDFLFHYKFFLLSGTTERICLIMGSPEAVRTVNAFIMEKIREKPESSPTTPTKPDDAKNNFERHRQVIEVFQVPFSSSFHPE